MMFLIDDSTENEWNEILERCSACCGGVNVKNKTVLETFKLLLAECEGAISDRKVDKELMDILQDRLRAYKFVLDDLNVRVHISGEEERFEKVFNS